MKKLTMSEKLAYSAPAFALAVVGIPVYIYLPKFYTDVVGVPVSAMGLILLLVRLFDAVTDPVIGLLSDTLKTPFGRRRPLILAGALLTALAILMLFNPPAESPQNATLWFTGWVFLLFLFWTVIIVPYESLGPELTFDYDERTSLFSMRDGALILGTLAAAASPGAIKQFLNLPPGPQGERETFFILSALYAPLIVASALWCVRAFKERERPPIEAEAEARAGLAGFRNLFESLRNRPFRILLISYTIAALGNNLPAALILYYVEYVLHSSRADFFLVLYFVTGIGFLPLWVAGARRFEKKAMWLLSMTVNTGAFFGVFFLGPGDETAYGVLVFGSGIGFGAALAIPSAIQADVIDYDELISGRRREGLYIGLWSVAKKAAAALGVGAGLAILGAAGYVPNKPQSETVMLWLRLLYALVPCLCNAAAVVLALNYPISGRVHRRIRDAIDRRGAGNGMTPEEIAGILPR